LHTSDLIISNTETDCSKFVFIDGPGGTGKTYLYQCIIHEVRSEGGEVLPVASTRIAANLLKSGRTYHSKFKIPLRLNETPVSGIKPRSKDSDRLRNSQLALAVDCVDRLAKEIMSNETAFGGKTFLLGGDFRQTLPIIPGADSSTIVQASLKYSKTWHEFEQVKLCTHVRSEDPSYSEWLIMLRNGDLTNKEGLAPDLIEIPTNMLKKWRYCNRGVRNFDTTFQCGIFQYCNFVSKELRCR
jgi:hypothetical protein